VSRRAGGQKARPGRRLCGLRATAGRTLLCGGGRAPGPPLQAGKRAAPRARGRKAARARRPAARQLRARRARPCNPGATPTTTLRHGHPALLTVLPLPGVPVERNPVRAAIAPPHCASSASHRALRAPDPRCAASWRGWANQRSE
jgi:hypothetical protein